MLKYKKTLIFKSCAKGSLTELIFMSYFNVTLILILKSACAISLSSFENNMPKILNYHKFLLSEIRAGEMYVKSLQTFRNNRIFKN